MVASGFRGYSAEAKWQERQLYESLSACFGFAVPVSCGIFASLQEARCCAGLGKMYTCEPGIFKALIMHEQRLRQNFDNTWVKT